MGMKVTGLNETAYSLENLHHRTNRAALREMRKGAAQIQSLAQDRAPVDKGNLEDSIKVDEDSSGLNRRKIMYVGIDEDTPIEGRPGKTVGDYALEMHESDYKLGKGSLDKQNATGERVGPKFLESAAEDLEAEIAKEIDRAIGRVL